MEEIETRVLISRIKRRTSKTETLSNKQEGREEEIEEERILIQVLSNRCCIRCSCQHTIFVIRGDCLCGACVVCLVKMF